MAEISREQVVDYLSNLPVIQIAELVKELETKWGVSAAPVAVAGAAAAGGGAAAAVEEKTEFDVVLGDAGPSKINVIKIVRELTGSRERRRPSKKASARTRPPKSRRSSKKLAPRSRSSEALGVVGRSDGSAPCPGASQLDPARLASVSPPRGHHVNVVVCHRVGVLSPRVLVPTD